MQKDFKPDARERVAYSVSELAHLVGVSRPTIYNWTKLPGFPVLRIGGVVRIPAGAFETWMNEQAKATF